jgi:hypothetical protein
MKTTRILLILSGCAVVLISLLSAATSAPSAGIGMIVSAIVYNVLLVMAVRAKSKIVPTLLVSCSASLFALSQMIPVWVCEAPNICATNEAVLTAGKLAVTYGVVCGFFVLLSVIALIFGRSTEKLGSKADS